MIREDERQSLLTRQARLNPRHCTPPEGGRLDNLRLLDDDTLAELADANPGDLLLAAELAARAVVTRLNRSAGVSFGNLPTDPESE